MQIVIEMDDEEYQKIMDRKPLYPTDASACIMAIQDGTPFPKGHGRLIDADAYREAWFNSRKFEPMLLLDFAPTVIEADKEVQERQPDS